MDLALTIAAFLALGWLLDRWLGTSPVFTITLLVIGAVGSFIRMKYAYDESMERLEADRRQRTQRSTIEDAA
jgi:F0F1-type ATP synthase assembly protein I